MVGQGVGQVVGWFGQGGGQVGRWLVEQVVGQVVMCSAGGQEMKSWL